MSRVKPCAKSFHITFTSEIQFCDTHCCHSLVWTYFQLILHCFTFFAFKVRLFCCYRLGVALRSTFGRCSKSSKCYKRSIIEGKLFKTKTKLLHSFTPHPSVVRMYRSYFLSSGHNASTVIFRWRGSIQKLVPYRLIVRSSTFGR